MIKVVFERARRRRGALLLGIALSALWTAPPAWAADRYALDIPPGPLDASLLRLAKQTGQQVFFRKALVAGRSAPALKGDYTPEQALGVLLAATDLSASRAGPQLLVLQRTSSAPVATRQPAREADAERPFVTAAALPAEAQPNAATSVREGAGAEPAVKELEAVVVTGSNIRGAPPASPLVVMSHDDLERTGQTTVADALRTLPANFGGGAGEGTLFNGGDRGQRNGAFGTALNLRGLGNNATLVLLNGRRLAGSGLFGDFVDISSIPSAAVERVEVLLDGASALYGSDAVGGVVNIIMRRDYEGAQTRILGGIATKGEPAQAQLSHTLGRRWGDGGVVASYEFRRSENLPALDRSFAGNADLRAFGGGDQRLTFSFPGNILVTDPVKRAQVPGFAIPAGQNGVGLRPSDFVAGTVNRSNQRAGADIIPKQTLHTAYVAVDQAVGDRLRLTADLRLGSRTYKSSLVPPVASFTVGRGNPFYVSPTGAASQTITYSFLADTGSPTRSGTANTLGLTLGGTLALPRGWRSEAYGAFAQNIEESRSPGGVNTTVLAEALGNVPDNPATAYNPAVHGYFNPFNGAASAANRTVGAFINSAFLYSRGRDRVSSVNVQADGPLWSLPGGDLKLALGAQARREGFVANNTVIVAAAPQTNIDLSLSRSVLAAFAEAQVPLVGAENALPGVRRLELSVAGRLERYQTFGTTANPKLGIVWAPSEDLLVRGTFGRSFRAPGLRELNDAALINSQQTVLGAGRVNMLTLAGGNPDLQPETATSWTLGADYRPAGVPGLTVSVTGFDIRFHDRIDKPVSPNLLNVLQDPTLSTFVTRISPATNAADLAQVRALLASPRLNTLTAVFTPESYVAIVDNRYVNTTTVRVQGLDVAVKYRFAAGGGDVRLAADATYMAKFEQKFTPTTAVINQVNVVNFPARLRGRATADWTRGRLTVGGAVNYVNAYRDALGVRIGDQPTFDAQVRLAAPDRGALKGVAALLNVRNVFDRDPPFYNNTLGIAYDSASADPIGRFVSLQLTRTW